MKVDTMEITFQKVDLNTQHGWENEKVPNIRKPMEEKPEDPQKLWCH